MSYKKQIAIQLIEKLNNYGYEAYIVGGAVRNTLSGIDVKDYDIATNALPKQIKSVFCNNQLIEIGIKHGTIGVVEDGEVYEITTFRLDGDYSDHRHPLTVNFVSNLKEDLSRRDFTINAMAFDKNFALIDYFGGYNDLKNHLIRAVGDPFIRFEEDALRILRAMRFASVYGFDIEEKTLNAMKSCKKNLHSVSAERIFNELNAIVCGKYCANVIYAAKEIVFELIDELRKTDGFNQYSLSHDYDVFNHTLRALKVSKCRKPSVMWALLLHDIGKPDCLTFDAEGYGHTRGHMERSAEIAQPILERLKFPNKLKNDVLKLIYDHDRSVSRSKYKLKQYIAQNGIEFTWDLYYHKSADIVAHSSYGIKRFAAVVKQFKYYLDDIILNNEICNINDLALKGDDIKNIFSGGKEIGKAKEFLFDAVLQNLVENDRTKLLNYLKLNYNNIKNR